MSGKSTFLKAMGLSVLMAQSIYTCPASEYRGGFYKLVTSIGRTDNVIQGRSYYLVEAQALLRIIEKTMGDENTFCIVDEIFRGTNSLERIIAARHALSYMVKQKCLVFVATHDLELAELLEGEFKNYYFRETVGKEGLEFDYLLKDGPSTTKNAIRLLEFLGYPEDITRPSKSELESIES